MVQPSPGLLGPRLYAGPGKTMTESGNFWAFSQLAMCQTFEWSKSRQSFMLQLDSYIPLTGILQCIEVVAMHAVVHIAIEVVIIEKYMNQREEAHDSYSQHVKSSKLTHYSYNCLLFVAGYIYGSYNKLFIHVQLYIQQANRYNCVARYFCFYNKLLN